MIHEITGDILRWIRKHGHLSQEEIATAIKKKRQVIWNWEKKGGMPSPKEEKILFEKAKCSRLMFAEIVCKRLTHYVGRRVMVVPEDQVSYMPTVPLARAAERYRENYSKLSPAQRKIIESKLRHGRVVDAAIDQMLSAIEDDIEREITRALEPEAPSSREQIASLPTETASDSTGEPPALVGNIEPREIPDLD